VQAPVCPTCRAHLEPALPLCVACGRLFPESEPAARALFVRHLPEDRRAAAEVPALLAAATGQDEGALSRYLQRGQALFRLPTSEPIARRLHDHLTDLGAQVELSDSVSSEAEWMAWARGLWQEKLTLVLLVGAAGIAAAYRGTGLFLLWFFFASSVSAFDRRTFARRISLSPAVLSRRLGLVSGALTRPAAALLRRARSQALRDALGTALVEHARLLAAVARALAGHPALQAPFRNTLDEVGEHTLRAAENALAIEEASDAQDVDLPQRLAELRALASEETDRQLRVLLTSREERLARQDWLARAHALLLIRLEAITERLRALRQETARRVLALAAADAPAADQSLGALGRELELAATALAEVERDLPRPLPEVVAEVITIR
jgi:hypothetical protein